MRTLKDATLFTVSGPRGTYYAVRDEETGAVLTERTESAASAMADERDLLIVDRREVGHAELIEMMASRASQGTDARASEPQPVHARGEGSGLSALARRLLHR